MIEGREELFFRPRWSITSAFGLFGFGSSIGRLSGYVALEKLERIAANFWRKLLKDLGNLLQPTGARLELLVIHDSTPPHSSCWLDKAHGENKPRSGLYVSGALCWASLVDILAVLIDFVRSAIIVGANFSIRLDAKFLEISYGVDDEAHPERTEN